LPALVVGSRSTLWGTPSGAGQVDSGEVASSPAVTGPATAAHSRRPAPRQKQVAVDDTTVALRLLVDRRDQLGRTRTEVVSRLHHLLLELVPGGAKQFLSAQLARALLNTVPRDVVGKTHRWLASELIHELVTIDKKIKIANQELTELVCIAETAVFARHVSVADIVSLRGEQRSRRAPHPRRCSTSCSRSRRRNATATGS
jgi:transposase